MDLDGNFEAYCQKGLRKTIKNVLIIEVAGL
jgi:hypothetical protein